MAITAVLQFLIWVLLLTSSVPPGQSAKRDPTKNPHGPLAISCESCHTYTSWKPIRAVPDFDHNKTRYPLRGSHEKVECRSCHVKPVFKDVGTKCADCHADLHRGQFGAKCEQCHTVKEWRVSIQAVRDHQNRFPLLGAHAAVDCGSCHTGAAVGQYTGLRTDCASCHLKDFQNAKPLDHRAFGFPTTCETCHTVDSWFGARFDHARLTRFELVGAHAELQCAACHTGGNFRGTPADCYSCHAKDYAATQNPSHVAAGFPKDCSRCHTSSSWQGARFDHNTLTKFPLTGVHVSVACAQCHINGRFAGTPTDCASCHLDQYKRTTNPNHAAAGFSTDCSICHTTSSWSGAKFDHSKTKFPLTGAHVSVPCTTCHVGGKYAGLSTTCVSCHLTNYNNTRNPNHVAAGFPQDCQVCHTTAAWSPASFDHNKTPFPLTGAHVQVPCSSCHIGGKFVGTPADCYACHKQNYLNTKDPNHVAAGFPTTCATCHTTSTWQGARFDHNALTKFPLTGAHVSVPCAQCHVNGKFAGTPKDCASCHLDQYKKTTNPNHVAAGFPRDCSICHTTSGWAGANFNHNTFTKFPLTGAHINVPCAQCHVNGRFAGTPKDCASCHINLYKKTTNPNHVAAGFPTDCSICHTTSSWAGAKFDHSKTPFPLTGAHVSVPCATCHVNDKFVGLSTDCVSCHLNNYKNTKNPNHIAAGFPQQCAVCHTTSAWTPATFDHNKTPFPLTGAHVQVACSSCHVGGRFAGTPTDCYACHKQAYQTTTNPNHVAAAFPTTCATCHTTSTWLGARFTHDKFPIYSGKHAGQWTTCADCHTNPRNFQVFSCVTCHAHEKTKMDQKHQAVRGYVYNSANCYSCHPQGTKR